MFFCLQKDAKQCCDATKMGCTYCSGRLLKDLGKMVTKNRSEFYNESGSAFYNESESGSSPRFITYQIVAVACNGLGEWDDCCIIPVSFQYHLCHSDL